MNRFRLAFLIGLLMLAGCTSSSDDNADAASHGEAVAGTASCDDVVGEAADAELPAMSEILVAGGASTEVADCQAEVLDAAGIREVDDLATMAEAMESLTSAQQQAMVDCVN